MDTRPLRFHQSCGACPSNETPLHTVWHPRTRRPLPLMRLRHAQKFKHTTRLRHGTPQSTKPTHRKPSDPLRLRVRPGTHSRKRVGRRTFTRRKGRGMGGRLPLMQRTCETLEHNRQTPAMTSPQRCSESKLHRFPQTFSAQHRHPPRPPFFPAVAKVG